VLRRVLCVLPLLAAKILGFVETRIARLVRWLERAISLRDTLTL
jgi:hypothetical protein